MHATLRTNRIASKVNHAIICRTSEHLSVRWKHVLPWVGMLLAVSRRGPLEGSWEEYLIQLEDRSETAETEEERGA